MPSKLLPPNIGEDVGKPLLYNPYQQGFLQARRLRYCLTCHTIGSMDGSGRYQCPKCKTDHWNNLTAPRVYSRFLILSGRRGGKTLIGAHACREEMTIPNSLGWVMGPTFEILHDSTFPTLIRLIPPDWVKPGGWSAEHMELTLRNGAKVAFRSLADPERARGPGPDWGWFDEAAQAPERAYHVFLPSLTERAGIVIATTTVLGFDWTYDQIEKKALVDHEPGYWACRYHTTDNPLFKTNPLLVREVEMAKATMTPDLYAQEYLAERRNATGLIYGPLVEQQYLKDAEAVRKYIPEWPNLDSSRQYLVGLDSGADHPFGALLIVATEYGLIVVREYLERQRAMVTHLEAIQSQLGTRGLPNLQWAANKNEAQLRLEFGLRGVGVIPAENKHEIGIQRTQSWLHSKQLFIAYTCPKTKAQMQAYRYAQNYSPTDGQKRTKEEVFKIDDELPDCLRYALMAWPRLPEASVSTMSDRDQSRWNAFDDRTKQDLERLREYNKQDRSKDLQPLAEGYPLGNFHNSVAEEFGFGW